MQTRLIRVLILAAAVLCITSSSFAAVGFMITIAPPPLPVYEQPLCPGDGYLWTPGYWAWGDDFDDYYWVPGTWILAPEVGYLWTPPYWGWSVDHFVFYDGYWGPTIGFYGGINYGFGYFGTGFVGGRWDGGHFFYNRAVMNINVTNINNVYETRVDTTVVNHVSYNGGRGGLDVRPTAEQEAAAHERHIGPVAAQAEHVQMARSNVDLRASHNEGKPPIAATERPSDFKGSGVVKAREAGGAYTRPENAGHPGNEARTTTATHVKDLPAAERPAAPNTGDAKLDKKYQQEQNKQYAQQQKERQKLQQQQEKEDQRAAKQTNDAQRQQMEQRHQQQTQQMFQRHQQQQQQMQQRIQASRPEGGGRPRR